jgi:hypothetical protein
VKRITIYITLSAAILFFAACTQRNGGGKPAMPSLKESFAREDKNPFGTYVAYNLVQQFYPQSSIKYTKKESVEKTWSNIYDTGSVYISVSNSLYTSEEDVEAIMAYVKAGNDMILSAAVFDDNLLDRIGCKLYNYNSLQDLLQGKMEDASVKLDSRRYPDTASYSYYYYPFSNAFSKLPQASTISMGLNGKGNTNFFVYFYGNGKLFLHCEPRAFSNYFLLQKNNYQYLQNLLGVSKKAPEHVYWNDYYTKIRSPRSSRSGSGGSGSGGSGGSGSNKDGGSTFDGLTGPLWWAFWLLLLLLVLYVLNGTKRRQRIIPLRKPNENTTVTFAETVGLLYLQKKDNKNIAEKMITYFNEFIRNQYFLNTNHPNQEFITTLSRKSGVPQDKVDILYSTISNTLHSASIDDYQLLSLNQQIQNFYKLRN